MGYIIRVRGKENIRCKVQGDNLYISSKGAFSFSINGFPWDYCDKDSPRLLGDTIDWTEKGYNMVVFGKGADIEKTYNDMSFYDFRESCLCEIVNEELPNADCSSVSWSGLGLVSDGEGVISSQRKTLFCFLCFDCFSWNAMEIFRSKEGEFLVAPLYSYSGFTYEGEFFRLKKAYTFPCQVVEKGTRCPDVRQEDIDVDFLKKEEP